MPQIQRFVRNPDICGTKPGWADTNVSMLMHFPRASSDSFQIEQQEPLECHGLQWARPKMHDMHVGKQSLSLTNFLLIFPFSESVINAGSGR